MTTGGPDFGVDPTQINEPQNNDVLELAAREGIYIPYARSGSVLFNLHPVILSATSFYSGTSGWYNQPSTKYAFYGYDYSVKTTLPAQSSTQAGFAFNPPMITAQQLGVMVYWGYLANNALMMFNCVLHVSGVRHQAELQFNTSNGVLSYYGTDGSMHTILTQNLTLFNYWPLITKFTFNLATGKYGKLWWNTSTPIDLSSYSYYQASEPQADSFYCQIFMNNQEAVANYFYLQDVIVTTNEVV